MFVKVGASPRVAVVVPQAAYQSRGPPIPLADPIKFYVNGNQGILLLRAFKDQFEGLSNAFDPVIEGRSPRVSYRIEVRPLQLKAVAHSQSGLGIISGPAMPLSVNRNTVNAIKRLKTE